MDDSEKIFSEFQNVILYNSECKKIRQGATVSIIWGLGNLSVAVGSFSDSPINVIPILVAWRY